MSTVWVNWTSMVYMICYIPLIIPASWALDRYGLRCAHKHSCAHEHAPAEYQSECTCRQYQYKRLTPFFRVVVTLGALGNCIGSVIKCFSAAPHLYWLTFTGQIIVGSSQVTVAF